MEVVDVVEVVEEDAEVVEVVEVVAVWIPSSLSDTFPRCSVDLLEGLTSSCFHLQISRRQKSFSLLVLMGLCLLMRTKASRSWWVCSFVVGASHHLAHEFQGEADITDCIFPCADHEPTLVSAIARMSQVSSLVHAETFAMLQNFIATFRVARF